MVYFPEVMLSQYMCVYRQSLTLVTVIVELDKNLGPIIPAPQYTVAISEGVLTGSEVFTVPVRYPWQHLTPLTHHWVWEVEVVRILNTGEIFKVICIKVLPLCVTRDTENA